MQFLYNENVGTEVLCLEGAAFKHLKIRRVRQNERLKMRNLRDYILYEYEITELKRHSCTLNLRSKSEILVAPRKKTALALGVIEPKILEKTLPFLNELGLYKLILVFTHFSQRNFAPDFERLTRILINSCEQCGRGDLMKFELFESTLNFANAYKNAVMVDFSGKIIDDFSKFCSENEILFIGAEGGFTNDERRLFARKIKLKSPYILRSQSAIISVAAKILA